MQALRTPQDTAWLVRSLQDPVPRSGGARRNLRRRLARGVAALRGEESQNAFAKKAGVSGPTINRIERVRKISGLFTKRRSIGRSQGLISPGDVSDPKSLFGHAAYYSTNGDDAGGVSWGTPVQFDDTGLDGFVQKYEAQGRKVRLFAIETTPAQDQQLIDLSSRPESDLVPSEGSMLSRNCARACSVALEEAGVVTPGTGLGEDQFGIATPTQLGADLVKSGVGVEVNPDPVSEDTPEQTQAKADKPHAGRTKY